MRIIHRTTVISALLLSALYLAGGFVIADSMWLRDLWDWKPESRAFFLYGVVSCVGISVMLAYAPALDND